MKLKFVCALALTLAGLGAQAAPRVVSGPYKHTAQHSQSSHVITFAPQGTPQPVVADGKRLFGAGTMSWAFATGECGEERWGPSSGQEIADANVAAFDAAGVGYIISTGGAEGVFTCATDAGMEAFVKRYMSKQMVGIDFDIEGKQTGAQIDSLVARAVHVQKIYPELRFSFTVATHATADGSNHSLNTLGETILAAARKAGLKDYTFNLMVMDYGPPRKEACVMRGKVCDMGKSALQAVRNVNAKHGIPFEQIEVTAMIGVNDMPGNDFGLDDARVLVKGAREMKLAGVHFWSLDRDRPCSVPVKGASPICSTMRIKAGAFNEILSQ